MVHSFGRRLSGRDDVLEPDIPSAGGFEGLSGEEEGLVNRGGKVGLTGTVVE